MSEEPPRIEVRKDERYRDIIVNGIFGGPRPGFFEAILYTDELVVDEAVKSVPFNNEKLYLRRTIQCRLVMDPVQAKSFAMWLNRHIQSYEKTFGKIVTIEELSQARARTQTQDTT